MTTHAARRKRSARAAVLSALMFAFAPVALGAQTMPAPAAAQSETAALNAAYALLAQHELLRAAALLRQLASASDLTIRATSQRQLAYTYESLGDRTGAVAALDRYLALRPGDDGAKLERAYDLAGAGRPDEARPLFVALQTSSDRAVAAAARKQVAAMAGGAAPNFETFGYAENESRFHDTFFGLDSRYRFGTGAVQPYAVLHFTTDLKAASVPASTILDDDALIASLGVQTPFARGADLFAEGGIGESLRTGISESDLRYGARVSRQLGRGGKRSQTEVDASAAWYSRYANAIGYATVAHDFSIGSSLVRGVTGADFAVDTSRKFYNNTFDGFAGVQIRRGTVTLRLSGQAGTYLPRGIDPPAQRGYTSVDLQLFFGYAR